MIKQNKNEYFPDFVFKPGETLLETLQYIGMSQSELARRTGRPVKTISEIINGKAAITTDTALQLERVLEIPAHFWNNLEQNYREYLSRIQETHELAEDIEWINEIPHKDMMRLGWIETCKKPVDICKAILGFFEVATPKAFRSLYQHGSVAFRSSKSSADISIATTVWLQQGTKEARRLECQPYNEQKFRSSLSSIRALTLIEEPKQFIPELQAACASCGVAVVLVPEIEIPGKSGTQLCGAARWLSSDRALIQLSLRYKDNGNFWFTFFHEAGHILLHSKRQVFMDEKLTDSGDALEAEANTFACDTLIPQEMYEKFETNGIFTEEEVLLLAQKAGIAPGIIVGRLQHEGKINWNHLNHLKTKCDWKAFEPSA